MNDIMQNLRLVMGLEGVESANAQLNGLNKAVGAVAKTVGIVVGAWVALNKVVQVGAQSLKEYERSIQAMRQIDTTLQSTGKSAMFTADELSNMAGELQKVSNFGDEDIVQGATLSLLRFDGIAKEMFPRVQALTVDLGQAMGGLENASRTLGISLADPTLGITRLRRAGVMFTESQEAMIKALVESGDKAGAQEILLAGLEQKYKGLALASVSASTQLKNAWGDYLESVGSSLQMFDGVKKGITMALYDINSTMDYTSKVAQTAALRTQEKWGVATIYVMSLGKAVFYAIGSAVMGVATALATSVNTIVNGANLVGAAIRMAVLEAAEFAIKYDPFRILLKSYNEVIKKFTGKDLKLTGLHDALLSQVQGLDAGLKDAWRQFKAGLDASKDIWASWADVAFNITSNTKEAIARQVAQLHELINKQIAGLDIEMPDLSGLGEKDLKAVAAGLKTALDGMLKAQAMYYETTGKYSQDWVDAQLALYKQDTEALHGEYLTKEQLDAMYLEKERELQTQVYEHFRKTEDDKQAALKASLDAQIAAHKAFLAEWKRVVDTQRSLELSFTDDRERWLDLRIEMLDEEVEAYRIAGVDMMILERWRAEQMKSIIKEMPESLKEAADFSDQVADAMKHGAMNALSNSMYDLITGAKSLEENWKNLWQSMLEATLRAITQMIAKMLVLRAVQSLLGVPPVLSSGAGMFNMLGDFFGETPTIASAGVGIGGFSGTTAQPAANYLNAQNRPQIGGIGMGYGDTTNKALIEAISELRAEIARDREQTFNLSMDGVELRSALKRVDYRLSVLGGSNV